MKTEQEKEKEEAKKTHKHLAVLYKLKTAEMCEAIRKMRDGKITKEEHDKIVKDCYELDDKRREAYFVMREKCREDFAFRIV